MNGLMETVRRLRELLLPRPFYFAKYHPAPRLGTRRVEQRLLGRLVRTTAGVTR